MLERLERQELDPAAVLEVGRHLGECSECARLAEEVGQDESGDAVRRILLDDLAETRHLDPDTELFPYADGSADAATREIVETHIEYCATCRADLEVLRRKPRSRGRLGWVLAAAAVLAGLVAFLTLRTPPAPTPPSRPPVVSVEKPAYERPEWAALVATTLRTGHLPTAAILSTLRASSETLRGSPSGESPSLEPAGVVLDTTRPDFSWPPAADATYRVVVVTGDEKVASSPRLTTAKWHPDRDLRRGEIYSWQVEVGKGEASTWLPSPPARPAMFRILSASEHDELAAARAAHPDDHLLLATLYAKVGMEREAKEELKRLDPRVRVRLR